MNWLILILACLVVCFGFVVLFGAPYLPTKKVQVATAFELLDLKKGQSFIELGCGDGRVLLYGAKQGLYATGYELNPILVVIAKIVTYRYRSRVSVVWGNYWYKDWPKSDGIFCFLLDKYMPRLDKKIASEVKKPIKLVSYAFKIPNKKYVRVKQGVFLYQYK